MNKKIKRSVLSFAIGALIGLGIFVIAGLFFSIRSFFLFVGLELFFGTLYTLLIMSIVSFLLWNWLARRDKEEEYVPDDAIP